MTSPAGTTQYHYDTITGRLDKITSPEGKEFTYSYNHGQLESLQYPNGITANYTFDDNGNLTLLDYQKDGSSLRHFSYTYGDANCSCKGAGVRTSMEDVDGLHEYKYDAINQITEATHPSVKNPLEQFTYDSSGNRLTESGNPFVWQYNELNQLTEDDSASYVYDADGNLTEKIVKATGDTTHFVWDIENKLVKVRKPGMLAEYTYDALGRRMSKEVNGVTTSYRYDGNNLILEMNGSDSIKANYTFGPGIDEPLMMNQTGTNYYYLKDGIWSVTAIADSMANIVHEYKYSIFGRITEEAGDSIENQFTYTSRELDRETGLMFYRARYYDPYNGRFLGEDPTGIEGKDFNLYRYVKNNPVNLTDPTGLESSCGDDANCVSGCINRCVAASGGNIALGVMGVSAPTASYIPKMGRAGRIALGGEAQKFTNLTSVAVNRGLLPVAARQLATKISPVTTVAFAAAAAYYATLRFVSCPAICHGNCNAF
jgi:RHS repeat-associated protein